MLCYALCAGANAHRLALNLTQTHDQASITEQELSRAAGKVMDSAVPQAEGVRRPLVTAARPSTSTSRANEGRDVSTKIAEAESTSYTRGTIVGD